MGAPARYEPEVVDKALLAMIAKQGSPAEAHLYLLENHDLEIPPATLSSWKTRDHPERYRQLEIQYGQTLEGELVTMARQNARRASEIEASLLERAEHAQDRDVPAALRAVADVKSKSIDKVLALTGRPTDGKTGEGSEGMGKLLEILVNRGVFTVSDPSPMPVVEGHAEDA